MAKALTTEAALKWVKELRAAPRGPDTRAALEKVFASPRLHGLVIKMAVGLAEEIADRELLPALVTALRSLMGADAVKRDPGCEAKAAIARLLLEWQADLPDVFLELAAYRQPEPAFDKSIDTAAELRGMAAIGIAQTCPPDAALRLVDLLADPEAPTRSRAATALGMWRGPEALAVLRLKALTGDPDPETLTEVFAALLRHDGRGQLPFIAEFLLSPEQHILEAAALALGHSRLPAALPPLTDTFRLMRRSPARTTILMAISLLRTDDSLHWLLDELEKANPADALSFLDALRIHHPNKLLTERLDALIARRPDLRDAYTEMFR